MLSRKCYILVVLGLLGLLGMAGCAEPWVKPYERENLADPIMGSENEMSAYYMKHVFENREAARGADGGTGGGCGCN